MLPWAALIVGVKAKQEREAEDRKRYCTHSVTDKYIVEGKTQETCFHCKKRVK